MPLQDGIWAHTSGSGTTRSPGGRPSAGPGAGSPYARTRVRQDSRASPPVTFCSRIVGTSVSQTDSAAGHPPAGVPSPGGADDRVLGFELGAVLSLSPEEIGQRLQQPLGAGSPRLAPTRRRPGLDAEVLGAGTERRTGGAPHAVVAVMRKVGSPPPRPERTERRPQVDRATGTPDPIATVTRPGRTGPTRPPGRPPPRPAPPSVSSQSSPTRASSPITTPSRTVRSPTDERNPSTEDRTIAPGATDDPVLQDGSVDHGTGPDRGPAPDDRASGYDGVRRDRCTLEEESVPRPPGQGGS